ncbi:UTRA domain-containing protein [Streptomyces sp. NPDC094032]|uniref:UTRA domain-containing protein n=1 Tax=Streptomyces sp. NPDC094032 TaxID=3155308 RepID=UPI00332A2A12
MKALGKRSGWESRTDAKVPAMAEIAARLGIGEGDLCVRTAYEFLADGRPVQLSTSWEPYDLTAGTFIVLPKGVPHAGAGVVNRMAAIAGDRRGGTAARDPEGRSRHAHPATYYSDEGRPVETADIVVPAALCEIVYEIPVGR